MPKALGRYKVKTGAERDRVERGSLEKVVGGGGVCRRQREKESRKKELSQGDSRDKPLGSLTLVFKKLILLAKLLMPLSLRSSPVEPHADPLAGHRNGTSESPCLLHTRCPGTTAFILRSSGVIEQGLPATLSSFPSETSP